MSIPLSEGWNDRVTTPWVWLAKITHPNLESPILVALYDASITYGGEVYLPGRMGIVPPNFSERDQEAKVRIANVDRKASGTIMRMVTPCEIAFSLVNAADPDTGACTWTPMLLANATGNAVEITGEFRSRVNSQDSWPKIRATKENAPGLYI